MKVSMELSFEWVRADGAIATLPISKTSYILAPQFTVDALSVFCGYVNVSWSFKAAGLSACCPLCHIRRGRCALDQSGARGPIVKCAAAMM